MITYILNSPILTGFGDWRYSGPLSIEQSRRLLENGFISAIGHLGTAELISALLSVDVPCDRKAIEMVPGDRALVFRLLERLPEGLVLDAKALADRKYMFCLLERLV
jgi:hypothetical protein